MNIKKRANFSAVFLLSSMAFLFAQGDYIDIPENPNFRFAKSLSTESPAQSYAIAAFSIAKYPVTNAEYKAFLSENPAIKAPRYWKNGNFPRGKEKHPVVDVSYDEAQSYCDWLSAKDKKHRHRLPSEAEWEFAARGIPSKSASRAPLPAFDMQSPAFNCNAVVLSHLLKENPQRPVTYIHTQSAQCGRTQPLREVVSFEDGRIRGWIDHKTHTGFVYTDLFKRLADEGGYTTPVDAYANASPFGVRDFQGNSWEWTSTPIVAENGAEKGKRAHAVRGGSWYATARSCGTDFRGEGRFPNGRYATVGFRVVRE